jgi:hypothetical protein
MRVNSDKQTLILAGEAIPRRDAARSSASDLGLSDMGPRLTLSTGGQNKLERSGYLSSARGSSFHAANEYARTQDFWGRGTRSTIIDTYA